MDLQHLDHGLLDGEHVLLDFDCKDFDEVGIHPFLDGDKQSPHSYNAGEVLKDIFGSDVHDFGSLPLHSYDLHNDAEPSGKAMGAAGTSTDMMHGGSGRSTLDESVFKIGGRLSGQHTTVGSFCTSIDADSGKRRREAEEEASSLRGDDSDDDDLPPGDRREKRRRSNRESARRGRMRRLEQLGKLETEVNELHSQHNLLLNKLAEAGDLLNAASRENRIYKTIAGYLGADQPELMKALQQANAAEGQVDKSVNEISDEEAEAIAAAALATNDNNPTKALMDLLNLAIQRNNMVV